MFHSSGTITNSRPTRFEEQSEGPQPNEQDQPQDGGDPQSDAQGQVFTTEQVQDQEQAQDREQAQDSAQDDQVTTPQLTPEEELERRATKIASKLTTKDHTSTRRCYTNDF